MCAGGILWLLMKLSRTERMRGNLNVAATGLHTATHRFAKNHAEFPRGTEMDSLSLGKPWSLRLILYLCGYTTAEILQECASGSAQYPWSFKQNRLKNKSVYHSKILARWLASTLSAADQAELSKLIVDPVLYVPTQMTSHTKRFKYLKEKTVTPPGSLSSRLSRPTASYHDGMLAAMGTRFTTSLMLARLERRPALYR